MVQTYKKKPVVVMALQFTGENADLVKTWMVDKCEVGCEITTEPGSPIETETTCVYIKTLEGTMKAIPGDYIIRGIHGEFYPCKPEIFELTYEKYIYKNE